MSEWKVDQLGNLAQIKGGKRLPKGEMLTTIPNSHPYIRTRDITNHKIAVGDLMYVPDDVFPAISRYTVEEGDVIISIVGTIGLCSVIPSELHLANLTENCAKIVNIDHTKLNYLFIYYYLISEDGQYEVEIRNVGSTQPKLPLYNIQTIPIPIPPLAEQKAISEVLSSLDNKIHLLHHQNETLEKLAKTLFRQLFIVEAEDHWQEGVIPNEFDFTMGLSPPGTSYNEEEIGTPMFQGNADFQFRFPQKRVFTTDPRRFAKKFDTLISVRAPVGEQNMAMEKCCIGRGVAAFRYKRKEHYYTYTYYKLKSLMAEIKQFDDSGTVFGSINKSDFEALEITIPPSELVDEFQREANPLDKKIYQNCSQIQTLENLRDILLEKIISGEARVIHEK